MIRLLDVVGPLSLATDLGNDRPLETAPRSRARSRRGGRGRYFLEWAVAIRWLHCNICRRGTFDDEGRVRRMKHFIDTAAHLAALGRL